ncbi:hypothetical protein BGS_1043 [Beggiatoa sp. SS]|nr:hypothetical protein BGS_1043 [Beggiatoa sp. SS]
MLFINQIHLRCPHPFVGVAFALSFPSPVPGCKRRSQPILVSDIAAYAISFSAGLLKIRFRCILSRKSPSRLIVFPSTLAEHKPVIAEPGLEYVHRCLRGITLHTCTFLPFHKFFLLIFYSLLLYPL